jgi:hypothetical protein
MNTVKKSINDAKSGVCGKKLSRKIFPDYRMTNDELTRADREFGEDGEIRAYETLKKLDSSIVQHTKRYDTIDFYGNVADIELKTRTCRYGAFPDIMINACKASKYKVGKKLYFAFQFTDGIWYIEYTPQAFSDIEKRPFKRIGSVYKEQLCFFIPLDRLLRL